MRKFQILNKDKQPISIAELDREVCEITGNEIDPKWYCPLGQKKDYDTKWQFLLNCPNWYDSIGWRIADQRLSFEGVLKDLAEPMQEYIGKTDEDGNIITLETIYPYHCKVINAWIDKGYTAVSLE